MAEGLYFNRYGISYFAIYLCQYISHISDFPCLDQTVPLTQSTSSGIAMSNNYYVSPVKVDCSTQPCSDVGSVIKTLANSDGIKIAQLNVRSLLLKRDQIEILLQQTNFHILFINESLIDDLISDAEISVPGYTSICNDRSCDGGGVLACFMNTLKFEHLKSFLSTSIESIWLKLFLGKNSNYWYCLSTNCYQYKI